MKKARRSKKGGRRTTTLTAPINHGTITTERGKGEKKLEIGKQVKTFRHGKLANQIKWKASIK